MQVDVIYTHHLPSVDVDYLLIQQVPLQKEEAFGSVRLRPLPRAGGGSDAPVNRSNNRKWQNPVAVLGLHTQPRDARTGISRSPRHFTPTPSPGPCRAIHGTT